MTKNILLQSRQNTDLTGVELARRNSRYTVINSFLLSSASFLLPIWQLFYTLQLGMSLTQAMILSSSGWIVTAIANIPTGAWADKFGRVKLFRIGIILCIFANLPMFFTTNYWILLTFSIIAGFASSMLDGSLEANVMDSYEKAGLPKKESSWFASSQMTAAYIGRISSGIAGAVLYGMWAFAPLLADILILGAVLIQSLLIREIRAEEPSQLPSWHFLKAVFEHIKSSRVLVLFLIVTLTISVGCESFWTAFQQYLQLRNVPTEAFGVVFGIIAAVSAFSSWGYRKIHERFNWIFLSFVTMTLMMVGLLISHITHPIVPFVVAVVVGLGFGLIYPVSYDVVQHNARSRYRSTVASVRQFIYLGGFAISAVLVGLYTDLFGRSVMVDIITWQALIFTLIMVGIFITKGQTVSIRQ